MENLLSLGSLASHAVSPTGAESTKNLSLITFGGYCFAAKGQLGPYEAFGFH